MNHNSLSATSTSRLARFVFTLAVLIVVACVCRPAQAQDGSLADAARQARTQKQTQPDANQAQQIADELSEDQNDTGAPGGFKTYNAGEYKLWVPAPYHVDGHDDAGVVLSGPAVGVKHPIVLIGTPIAVHFQNNDAAFEDTATQFSHLYAQTASCSKTTVANHNAYQCGLAAANLMGTRVSGNAVFVLGSGSVYPVFCVVPSDSMARDVLNNKYGSTRTKEGWQKNLSREDDDARSVYQKCDTVFQSIRLMQDAGQHQAVQTKVAKTSDVQPAATASTQVGNSSMAVSNASGSATNATPQNAAPPAQAVSNAAPGSTVPAGFKVHAFTYCKSHNDCWNASVFVPADAQMVSSSCKQYAFETKVQGTSFLLMAGPAAADCDGQAGSGPDLVRWNQLADPENKRAPGTYSTISSLNTTLDGKPAVVTTMSFRKGLESWMGKRAEIESNGVPLVIGCMALRDHFADGDAICSRLIESLRLP